MKGGPVTIQLPKIEASESRLLTDNSKQNSDPSFEQKLNYEKTRLGLAFSPFYQLQSLFDSSTNFSFNWDNPAQGLDRTTQLESPKTELQKYSQNSSAAKRAESP